MGTNECFAKKRLLKPEIEKEQAYHIVFSKTSDSQFCPVIHVLFIYLLLLYISYIYFDTFDLLTLQNGKETC